MFMTHGEPDKDDNYPPELDNLLGNGWFKASQRFAVLIGRDTINSLVARAAVSKFVTSEAEGIINAADAAAIAAEVQAKTIHTIQIATKHGVSTMDENIQSLGGFEDDNGGGFGGFGGFDGMDDGSFI